MLKVSKKDRLAALRLVILSNELSSQEEVIQAMSRQGIAVTQTTLSRDMKQLKVAKAADSEGRYVYALPEEASYRRMHRPEPQAHNLLPSPGYKSIQFSGNMGVIKTHPGFASSIASNIDQVAPRDVIGTIAGDDTIFIVLREGAKHLDVVDQLSAIIPDMEI